MSTPEQTTAHRESLARHLLWRAGEARRLIADLVAVRDHARRLFDVLRESFGADGDGLRAWCHDHLPPDLAELFPALAPPAPAPPGDSARMRKTSRPSSRSRRCRKITLAGLVELLRKAGGELSTRALARNHGLTAATVHKLAAAHPDRLRLVRLQPPGATGGRPRVVLRVVGGADRTSCQN